MKTNLFRYVLFVGILFLLQMVEERFAKAFTNVPWQVLISVDAIAFGIFGAMAYRLFHGSVMSRVLLVIAIPVAASVLLEMIIGSDPAYPYVILLLGIPYALAFAVGAIVMAFFQRSRSNSNPAA
jgi:hypothetical protein